MRRRPRPYEALSLRERLALDCEFKLVETLEDREDDDPWIIADSNGNVFHVQVSVDERLDRPVVDVLGIERVTGFLLVNLAGVALAVTALARMVELSSGRPMSRRANSAWYWSRVAGWTP